MHSSAAATEYQSFSLHKKLLQTAIGFAAVFIFAAGKKDEFLSRNNNTDPRQQITKVSNLLTDCSYFIHLFVISLSAVLFLVTNRSSQGGTNMSRIIETTNLTKYYGKQRACEKISIHVNKGEIYGLIGRNGAGKTTVLRIISGLSNATSGEYSINGKSGKELAGEKRQVGTLIEAPGLYPNMTAYDNLKIKCIATGKNSKEYIDELLSLVGLTQAANKRTKEFSLGMRQRLGIALALAGDPELIILDEPINGLDPQGIAEVREILFKLSKEKGITIIISSHILDELAKIADSYGIIHEGFLLDEMTAQQLEERCGEYVLLKTNDNEKAIGILREMNIEKIEITEEETIRISSACVTENIVDRLVASGIKVKEIFTNRLTLEEYYLNITGGAENA